MTYRSIILALATALILPFGAAAQQAEAPAAPLPADSMQQQEEEAGPPLPASRNYTKDAPLIYEGSWDLWPYTFQNVKGEPDGYSVDLVRLILDRLHIPYAIKLKSQPEVFNDLREGRSDLMLGIAAGFHDEYGQYGNTAITLFTQSVATPRSQPVTIHTFSDLAHQQVTVNAGSLAYHLMVNQGWGENAKVTTDITEAMLTMSSQENGIVLWNNLGLKWLVRRYRLDNLVITPVNMPHGEYKFMSNDPQLLASMDSIYDVLNSEKLITPLQNKWFYPERREKVLPPWVWYAVAGIALLLVVILAYGFIYRLQGRRINRENNRRFHRLALILETSEVHIWTYDVKAQQFTWRNENGQAAYTYTPEEFSQRYSPEDYQLLRNTIFRLAATPAPADGKEEEVRLSIKAKDMEEGSGEVRDYIIAVSVLRRNSHGKVTAIIGTKKDVTETIELQHQANELTLHYHKLFNTRLVGIMYFNKYGLLKEINEKACQIYGCQAAEVLERRPSIYDLFSIGSVDISELDGMHAWQQEPACEYCIIMVPDEKKEPLGFFAIARQLIMAIALLLSFQLAMAQQWKQKFTPEHPLIIVGDWDAPPYEFLNGDGQPSGTNVETMDRVCREMDLPYKYVLKDWSIATKMFERGDADIILAFSNTYPDSDFVYSDNIVNYYHIMAATLGTDTAGSVSMQQLLTEGVVLKPASYSTYFFRDVSPAYIDKIAYQSPKVALTGLTDSIYKYFVWSEDMLKWKIHEYDLDGIVLHDVPIPVCDIYIIGHDRELVDALDDQFSRLKQSGDIQAIIDNWRRPSQEHQRTLPLNLLIAGGIVLLAALFYLFNLLARRHVKAATRKSTELNNMMIRALHMGSFDVTEYDIRHDEMKNQYGSLLPEKGISLSEFTQHIHPSEQEEFRHKIERLLNGREKKFVLNKRWKSYDDDSTWLYLHGHAIVETDGDGQPAYIINAIHDVTNYEQEEITNHETACKFEALSNLPPMARALYEGRADFAVAFDNIFLALQQQAGKESPVTLVEENPYDTFPTRIDVSHVQQVLAGYVSRAVSHGSQGILRIGYRYQQEEDSGRKGLYIYCEGTHTDSDRQQDERSGSTYWLFIPCKKEPAS